MSLRLEMDLQARCSPVPLSSARRVVPNWPRPSTLPSVYSWVTSCRRRSATGLRVVWRVMSDCHSSVQLGHFLTAQCHSVQAQPTMAWQMGGLQQG